MNESISKENSPEFNKNQPTAIINARIFDGGKSD